MNVFVYQATSGGYKRISSFEFNPQVSFVLLVVSHLPTSTSTRIALPHLYLSSVLPNSLPRLSTGENHPSALWRGSSLRCDRAKSPAREPILSK